ncbi:MAG TPA: homocysteine S-methyltransferase family protein [Pseudomonadota bacterium]|nr:homocysteine S-methyltransferase family protein [Pseudomonadota bacterium]
MDALLAVAGQATLWLDGPTGTQLEAGGFVLHPRLWTAMAAETAPTLLAEVHRSYLQAGAQAITANTFRTTAYAAAAAGVSMTQARRWTADSVAIARRVVAEFSMPRWVLGSLAPLADCYRPEATPDDTIVEREHARTADWLLEAGCDGLLLETQGCGREVRLALAAVRRSYRGPLLVSLLSDESGERLLDGSDLQATARVCAELGASALLINCAHAEVTLSALSQLRVAVEATVPGLPFGAYPNADRMVCHDGQRVFTPDDERQTRLVERMQQIRGAGASILGLCCGFGPADLQAVIDCLEPRRSGIQGFRS